MASSVLSVPSVLFVLQIGHCDFVAHFMHAVLPTFRRVECSQNFLICLTPSSPLSPRHNNSFN